MVDAIGQFSAIYIYSSRYSSSIVLRVRCVCQFINSAVILPNAPHCILHQTRESFSCHKILNHCAIAAFIDFCTISPEKKSIYGAYAMKNLVLFFSLIYDKFISKQQCLFLPSNVSHLKIQGNFCLIKNPVSKTCLGGGGNE